MKRFFGIFLGIMIVGVSAYFALTKSNLSEYSFPDVFRSKNGTAIADYAIPPIVQKVSEDVADAFKSIAAKGSDIIDGLVDGAKNETFDILKDTVNKKIDNVGESFGVSISPERKEEINSPVIFTMKKGSSAYFTIENREDARIRYQIDWQDGGTGNTGSLDARKSKVVSHSWDKAGNYDIQFKIISSEKNKTYNITLSIF